jgi:hypothetical protein
LAAKSDAPERVAEAAGVTGLRRAASWQDGVAAVHAESGDEPSCLVAGPIDGWVLVASTRLPHLRGENALAPLLERASARLDGAEVQAFASLPMQSYAAWARARAGKVVRSFYGSGAEDAGREAGDATEAERELGLPGDDPSKTSADDVLAVAARWSLDPTSIPLREVAGMPLWTGSLPDPEAELNAARERARDLASRDVDAAMAQLEASNLLPDEPPPPTSAAEKAEKLAGMATHMASLGYTVAWAADRRSFAATPPEGSPFPPMSFGLDDV